MKNLNLYTLIAFSVVVVAGVAIEVLAPSGAARYASVVLGPAVLLFTKKLFEGESPEPKEPVE